jgi:hypothetical protein
VDKTVSATLVIVFLVVVLGLMYLGWRARGRRQSVVAAPQRPPVDLGEVLGVFDGFYVATTLADDRFNRVSVGGLGFRAKSDVVVARAGVVVPIAGQPDIFIPAVDITGVEPATWTIDRVVEGDGLTMIAWGLGETPVESYFRARDGAGLIAALSLIAPITTESDSK